LGIEAFSGVLSGDGTGILGPLWQRGTPKLGGMECGLYSLGDTCWREPTD